MFQSTACAKALWQLCLVCQSYRQGKEGGTHQEKGEVVGLEATEVTPWISLLRPSGLLAVTVPNQASTPC